MGQHPVYNGVIKSKGAIKMTRKELQTMLKQLSYLCGQIRAILHGHPCRRPGPPASSAPSGANLPRNSFESV